MPLDRAAYDIDEGDIGASVAGLIDDINREVGNSLTVISASGAVSASKSQSFVVTKAGVAALTLAAPAADGLRIEIFSTTAFAHTLTATGLFQNGAATTDVATFAAHAGASVRLRSYNGKWLAVGNAITFS